MKVGPGTSPFPEFQGPGMPRIWLTSFDSNNGLKSSNLPNVRVLGSSRPSPLLMIRIPARGATSLKMTPPGVSKFRLALGPVSNLRSLVFGNLALKPVTITLLPQTMGSSKWILREVSHAAEGSVAPTALDEGTTQAFEGRAGPDRSRSPPRASSEPVDPCEAQKQGWRSRDLGGKGDCFFRSIAEGLAHQESPAALLTEAEAIKRGATWRAASVGHARKHANSFRAMCASQEEFDSWLEQAACVQTSAEGKLIQAFSEKAGVPVIIWSWSYERGSWQRATIAGKFSKGFAMCSKHKKPITVLLRDKHYCVLTPPENVDAPSSWLRETRVSALDLAGAGVTDAKSPSPVRRIGPRDAHDEGQEVEGEPTPSIHSVVGAHGSPSPRHSVASTPSALGPLDEGQSQVETKSSVGIVCNSLCGRRETFAGPAQPSCLAQELVVEDLHGSKARRCVRSFSPALLTAGNLPQSSKGSGFSVLGEAAPVGGQTGKRDKNVDNLQSLDAVIGNFAGAKRRRLNGKCKGFRCLGSVCQASSVPAGTPNPDIADLRDVAEDGSAPVASSSRRFAPPRSALDPKPNMRGQGILRCRLSSSSLTVLSLLLFRKNCLRSRRLGSAPYARGVCPNSPLKGSKEPKERTLRLVTLELVCLSCTV